MAVHSRHLEFLHELTVPREDMNAVRHAICAVDEPIMGHVQRQMAPELLGHWPVRGVFAIFVVGGDFRQLVPVGAPAALEREAVQIKHHHAPAQVIVGGIKLVIWFV